MVQWILQGLKKNSTVVGVHMQAAASILKAGLKDKNRAG
jgi:hypothetical protein